MPDVDDPTGGSGSDRSVDDLSTVASTVRSPIRRSASTSSARSSTGLRRTPTRRRPPRPHH